MEASRATNKKGYPCGALSYWCFVGDGANSIYPTLGKQREPAKARRKAVRVSRAKSRLSQHSYVFPYHGTAIRDIV